MWTDAHQGGAWARLRDALTKPHDVAALAVFRMALGAIVTISAIRFFAYDWIDQCYVMPRVHFSYWGFGWLPLPSPSVTYALFALLGVSGLLVAIGLFYRPAVAALFLIFTYLQLIDVANYLNHYYLVSLLAGLMFFVPANRAWSLDVRISPRLRRGVVPAWCTYLLRFQVAVVYVNAGLAKATTDWLLHAQPLNIWLSARTSLPIVGPYLDLPAVAYLASWSGFLFDTSVAFFLLWRRTRPAAYLAVLGFHAATHFLFPGIGMFPVIMIAAALVFFDPSWPRRAIARGRRLVGAVAEGVPAPAAPAALSSRFVGVGVGIAAAFMTIQLLLPLRTHLYGGNVLWHEQGMRFSWRVLAREKNGSVTFVVRDPANGREWHVSPTKYLTRVQEREMAGQPDLILQLAHHIARDFAARGHPGVAVHADALVSLNGRPAAPFIDPSVDLARETDGFAPKQWISPTPAGSPPHLRSVGRGRELLTWQAN